MILLTTNGDDVGVDLVFISGPQLFAIVTVVGLIAALWVYRDARRRAVDNPGIWAIGVGFLFLFYALPGIGALLAYLVVREPDED